MIEMDIWRGKKISDMSKGELIRTLNVIYNMLTKERVQHSHELQTLCNLQAEARKAIERNSKPFLYIESLLWGVIALSILLIIIVILM